MIHFFRAISIALLSLLTSGSCYSNRDDCLHKEDYGAVPDSYTTTTHLRNLCSLSADSLNRAKDSGNQTGVQRAEVAFALVCGVYLQREQSCREKSDVPSAIRSPL